MKTLVTAHLLGNALLLWLFYYWLGRDESSGLYLFESAGLALLIALGALWLHGTSLAYFRQRKPMSASKLLPLIGLAAILAAIYVGLAHAYNTFGHDAFVIGSYTTLKLRRPVAPSGVMRAFHVLIWIARWIVIPVLALPIAAEICNRGWAGFWKAGLRTSRRPLFWIECVGSDSIGHVGSVQAVFLGSQNAQFPRWRRSALERASDWAICCLCLPAEPGVLYGEGGGESIN